MLSLEATVGIDRDDETHLFSVSTTQFSKQKRVGEAVAVSRCENCVDVVVFVVVFDRVVALLSMSTVESIVCCVRERRREESVRRCR